MTAILPFLTIDANLGPEAIRVVSTELAAVGHEVQPEDIVVALRTARAYRNGTTGEWVVPNSVQPTFGYDGLQDAIMERTGFRGPELYRAWTAVKGRLRVRWAQGNHKRPNDAIVARWARDAVNRAV